MPQSRFIVSLAQTSLPAALEHPPRRTLDFGIEGGKGLRAEVEPLIVKTVRRAS